MLASCHVKTWGLDPLGNWTSGAGESGNRGHNKQNQLTSVNGATLAYDKNGNVNKDQSGKTLLHDAWNRLLRVRDKAGKVLLSYSYDALGRRLTRTLEDVPTTPVPVHLYYSADWQLLQERVNNVLTTEYVWSPVYVDAMILRDRDLNSDGVTTDPADERLYVQQDANWNVTAVVDKNGVVKERYVYDPYGQPTVYDATWSGPPTADPPTNWVYLHQGGRYNSSTGLYHFRHRDYSPSLGRWLQQDPIKYEAGDSNLYRAEGNNPVRILDPLGLAGQTVQLAGGIAEAYLEWFPDKGIAEMKVIYNAKELVRYRWSKANPRLIQTILQHGGKKLPGVPNHLMNRISLSINYHLKTIVNNASGTPDAFCREMTPRAIREAFPQQGRPGYVSPKLLATLGATAIVAGGVTYAYDEYLGAGLIGGIDLAQRAGLGKNLMLADGDNLLPGRVFDVIIQDRTIHVSIVDGEPGKMYITAWYSKARWSLFYGSYSEPVDLIRVDHNYRVHNVK